MAISITFMEKLIHHRGKKSIRMDRICRMGSPNLKGFFINRSFYPVHPVYPV
jgi:hypothetical protein